MKINVCVIGYDRPFYLNQCMEALSKLTSKPNHVHVFLDRSPSTDSQAEYCSRLDIVDTVTARDSQVGIPLQWYDALNSVYTNNADAVLILEEDVVIKPGYLNAIESMLQTYSDSRISFVSSFPDKVPHGWPEIPWTTGDHLLGVATTKQKWEALKPFYEHFLDGRLVTTEGCLGEDPKYGQDVALYCAMSTLGTIPLFSRYRMARYIGQHGLHGTVDDYREKGWGSLPLHNEFEHPPMSNWWLTQAIALVRENYGDHSYLLKEIF
mgnify:CR=1 FL=1